MSSEMPGLTYSLQNGTTTMADLGLPTTLCSVGPLDVLSNTSVGPSVARLVSMPVCASSLRSPTRNMHYKCEILVA